jgi:hypothetical protein
MINDIIHIKLHPPYFFLLTIGLVLDLSTILIA